MARFHSFTRPKESIPTMAWVESLAPGVFLVRARSAGQSYYSPQKKYINIQGNLINCYLVMGFQVRFWKKTILIEWRLCMPNADAWSILQFSVLFAHSHPITSFLNRYNDLRHVANRIERWRESFEWGHDASGAILSAWVYVNNMAHRYTSFIALPVCLLPESMPCFCRYKSCTIEPREQTTRKQLKCSQAERREIVWRFPGPGFTWYQHERTPKKVQPLHWWVLIKVFKVTSLSILCCLCSLQHVTTPSSGPTSSH